MTYFNFDKLEDLEDGDILFFDELLNGNPTVLNACLTILEQRRFISGAPLPDIMIVAAANPQGMTPLTPQIKERFVWYEVNFDPKMWKEYMVNKYGITNTIGNKLCSYIQAEKFTGNNFHTPRSVDKAIDMMIKKVPTPYRKELEPVVAELITNTTKTGIPLAGKKMLKPGETISWIDLIRYKHKIK